MRKLFLIILTGVVLTVCGCQAHTESAGLEAAAVKTESYTREPYSLELSYPSGELDFGSSAEIVLTIEYPENEKYILMPPDVKNGKSASNTVITDIQEKAPVLDGHGKAVSRIIFNVEAWLPGELIFPSLSVSFGDILTTDEIVINVVSAFDAEDAEHGLSPLYIPANSKAYDIVKNPAVLITVIVLLSLAVFLILFIRHRKKKADDVLPVKTRSQIIEDFKKSYIDTDADVDLRAAFSELEHISGVLIDEKYSSVINEARFSRNSISTVEGRALLLELFQKLIEDSENEL